ncbi:hypothetical protein GGR54DRAFT_652692 [Hypoxylon sp. NC1633]|nr:hypothetical protein GGR54DRAFT_652692 [Hypoxylon sp. NC1633]
MDEQLDTPIALRRTPRASSKRVRSPDPSRLQADNAPSTRLRTPRRKKVRFSDPGPKIRHDDASSTTGLTPMVRRSSIGGAPSPKRRRHSIPLRLSTSSIPEEDEDELNSSGGHEVRFLSMRQILDDRVKRRIRRNGLSEEMNTINQEKRRRVREHRAELQRLQNELAEKDQEIERLQNTTMAHDTDRILELESEIETLRNELHSRSSGPDDDQTQHYDWTLAARDPFSDSYMDDDEGFGDATMADLVSSTPSKARASASFPTPPCTSPAMPATPCSTRRGAPVTPQSHHHTHSQSHHVGVQASFPCPEKEALEAELRSLRLELAKLTEVLESHEALKSRIACKLAASIPLTYPEQQQQDASNITPNTDVEAHLDAVLRSLSDRTAALLDLNASLSALGFAGRDAGEILSTLTSAFRTARLELEYLTPGELTLPLTARGAQVLDLVLARLRTMARRVSDDEGHIDEYHALELSLRQQLGARVGAERLKGAAESYRRDVAELEALVTRLEAECEGTAATLRAEVDGARAELADSRASAAELEAKLAAVREQAEVCATQMADLQRRKAAEVKALNKYHGIALAVRDARVTELRRKLEDVQESLHGAHATIHQMRVENLGLRRRADGEKTRAREVVDSMKAELERVLQSSFELLADEGGDDDDVDETVSTTPDGSPRRSGTDFVGGATTTGKGMRRKYDSGLGLMDEDEDFVELV